MLDHFKTSDGIRIAYHVDDFSDPWRSDPPLIMLHAAMGHSRRFYAMVPTLCRHFRTIRMDLRGHGESRCRRQVGSHGPADRRRVGADGAARPSFRSSVGGSAGGYISQHWRSHPEKVLSLSLFASPPGLKNSAALTGCHELPRKGFVRSGRYDRGSTSSGPRRSGIRHLVPR